MTLGRFMSFYFFQLIISYFSFQSIQFYGVLFDIAKLNQIKNYEKKY
tara:strand:- start:1985 stop:2125 length:141 start_codon:yes stop_codon:yes gene_type:complete